MDSRRVILMALSFGLMTAIAAQKEVVVVEEKVGKTIKLFLLNKTNQEKEVSLKVDFSGCTSAEQGEISRKLAPGEKSYAMTLSIVQGSPCMYRSSIQIAGQASAMPESNPYAPTPVSELVEDQVNIFTKKGCARCKYVLDKLKELNIPYKEFDTSGQPPHNSLMFYLLRQRGFRGNSVDMPVIVSKGKIEYNLPDLDKWLATQH